MLVDVQKRRIKITFVAVFLIGLVAHAFEYFNLMYNHDSLMVFSRDDLWQISLGRYLQPVYLTIRGRINAPWLIGVLSLFFLSVALCFLFELFQIKNTYSLIAFSGVCVTSATCISMNATYLPWADIFMLALLLGILALWLTNKYRFGFVLGGIMLALSMALYQCYMAVFVSVTMIYTIYCIITKNEKIFETVKRVFRAIICAGIASVFYILGLMIMLKVSNCSLTDGYNGIANVSDFSDVNLFQIVERTYTYFIEYFMVNKAYMSNMHMLANTVLFVVTFVVFCISIRKRRLGIAKDIMILVIALVLPFGMNMIFFLSKGWAHELTTFSFNLVYLFPLLLEPSFMPETNDSVSEKSGRTAVYFKVIGAIIMLCLAVIVFRNIRCANQTYLKKNMVYTTTQSTVNRLLTQMEMTEGYIDGQTPVLFIGHLSKNPCFTCNFGEFEDISVFAEGDISITYPGTEERFMGYAMNTDINIAADEEKELIHEDLIRNMPVFPQKDSCQMFNGIMVVKLSE